MLTKNELIRLWRSSDFRPLKRLGQNFLIDKNIQSKIINLLDIDSKDTVLEIGPGFGEMTFDFAEIAQKVIAVEKDKKIVNILKVSFKLPKNIELIEKDFLDLDIRKISHGKQIIIYANLPYYITSPVIEKLLNSLSFIKDIYLVVQKEVADRISAVPGSRNIGRFSLFTQYYTEPQVLFTVKKGSFFPVPKVESALLRLKPLEKKRIEVEKEKFLFEIIKIAYGQRRKTIINSLSRMGVEKKTLSDILESIGINPQSRPETFSLDDFIHIAKSLKYLT